MRRETITEETPERLRAESRREALLDIARALVDEAGPAGVSMGAVAERAEVTRALVYKHFANREDMLTALYHREAAALDRELRRQVAAAPEGFEPKLRALIQAVGRAVDSHGPVFAPLRSYGQDPAYRRDQRAWDRRTVGYFASLAGTEYGIDRRAARPAVAALLSGIVTILTQSRGGRGRARRVFLEDLFVDMATAALSRVAERSPAADDGASG